ncbi:NB-ARC domain-containing protein [Pokkaliibacter sp. MBI-7]|uniref:NB-ARC domain-containing protein n=1 Tax=Pokkaliibacter sp. MBI-7 TaxID=3040600 RepID=UPI002447085E|nr:NB-ARC domain-containing protein [Pokkaliibacter sp. MBI-7]MDH2434100.1 NB-ARC domain-containing protein [Pokkaliibacter sp. MBI-7]
MTTDIEITSVSSNIHDLLKKASVGPEVIKTLLISSTNFFPKEGWLWDYKAQLNSDNISISKTILQVVSFHNTCGGYLIYGVTEKVKDKEFIHCDIDFGEFNPAQLRDKIKSYTGSYIDVTFKEVTFEIENQQKKFGLLHIPKRQYSSTPLAFIKNGPEKSNGKILFNKDDTYFRYLDECHKASTPQEWQTLFSPREFNPNFGLDTSSPSKNEQYINHNLPDKNLICSNFIGRDKMLSELWKWLSDEFEYTKILSGDGGKGKTSIAYEFCRSFIKSPPQSYERIIWLSIKQRQFSGFSNQYYNLQDSDFTDSLSFLICLADNFALLVENYNDISDRKIKRDLREALPLFPSLIVVDDIDSLEEEEQRKVVDSCRQLGSMNVRFLITTRKKLAYSADLCLDVPGLTISEFNEYISSLIHKYNLPKLRTKEIEKLHEASDGSPLLSASILRIYKQGVELSIAIKDWRGQAGEDARAAALKREIQSLSTEAKRVLLAIYYLRNCSFTEIKQAAGVEKTKLFDHIEELQSLFLVNEPKIIDEEERFSLSNTTSLIIGSMTSDLAFDHKKLLTTAKSMREKPVEKKSGNRRKIGIAINQAMALIKEGLYQKALETVDAELKHLKDNPDLLLMKARCLLSFEKPNKGEAEELLRRAISQGQEKEIAYELWFKAEEDSNSANGIIEVSEKALALTDSNKNRWNERIAKGYILRSKLRDTHSAIRDLNDANNHLTKTLENLSGVDKEIRIAELNSLHDLIWKTLEQDSDISWLTAFDYIYNLIKQGDLRTVMYKAAKRCLDEEKSEKRRGEKRAEVYRICLDKFSNLLNERSSKDKTDRPFTDLLTEL